MLVGTGFGASAAEGVVASLWRASEGGDGKESEEAAAGGGEVGESGERGERASPPEECSDTTVDADADDGGGEYSVCAYTCTRWQQGEIA